MEELYLRNLWVYREHEFRREDLLCRDGRFVPGAVCPQGARVVDGRGRRLIPGMIDIHTHGGAGVDVNAADEEGLRRIAAFFATQGVTAWNCSILTDTPEQTKQVIRCAVEVTRQHGYGAQLMGIHLEGPFLAPSYKGAMPESLLKKGDAELFRAYQREAGGAVRYLTAAPEVEGVLEMIREIAGETVVSIGHSAATYDGCMEAVRLGASCFTHTFNAMRLFHQHEPAVMGAALESDGYCEAICDGRHLHPGAIRMLLKCKGWDKVVAVTDSIMAAGLPDGRYKLGVNDVVVENGDAKLADSGVRAGSTLTSIQALKNLLRFTGEPLEKVIPLLTENPAGAMKLDKRKGYIREGYDADAVLLDEELNVAMTMVEGKIVFCRDEP